MPILAAALQAHRSNSVFHQSPLGATERGPGARLDEQIRSLKEALRAQGREEQHQFDETEFESPGAELDAQIRALKEAVVALEAKNREQASVRLKELVKVEDSLFDQNEDILDRPRRSTEEGRNGSEEPTDGRRLSDKELIQLAVTKAVEETQSALNEAIDRTEKHLEVALKQGQVTLTDGVRAIVEHFVHNRSSKEGSDDNKKWA